MDNRETARIEALLRENEELREKNRQSDRRVREAEEDVDRERRRAEKAEKRMQNTTIEEYLEACQKHLFDRFKVKTNMNRASQGIFTDPTQKYCPTRLLPWTDFLDKQRTVLGEFYELFPLHERLFLPLEVVKRFGDDYAKSHVKDEGDVGYVQRITVQVPVTRIIEEIVKRGPVSDILGVGSNVEFQNHVLPASENVAKSKEPDIKINKADNETDDVVNNQTNIEADNETDNETDNEEDEEDGDEIDGKVYDGDRNDKTRPDQTAVHLVDVGDPDNSNRRAIAFVVEYKAPHKLTAAHIRHGLQVKDIMTEVVNRPDSPKARDPGRFEYVAEKLVAAAITQTYHYMIQNGLEYSYLTTSEAFVFLKIDWRSPGNLYFHLAEPSAEVAAHGDNGRYCTAVSQVLAFSLLAVRTRQQRRAARIRATIRAGLKKWAVDWQLVLLQVSDGEGENKSSPDEGSNFTPSPTSSTSTPAATYPDVDRSPICPRKENGANPVKKGRAAKTCRPSLSANGSNTTDRDDDDSMDELAMDPPTIPAITDSGSARSSRFKMPTGTSNDSNQGSSHRSRKRFYCTQQCLLGLVCGFRLDRRCPNTDLHRHKTPASNQHPVDHKTWQRLLAKQLARISDAGLKCLWKQGARGALIRITLLEYGYTFVAKGTDRGNLQHLQREARMYKRLRPLQGNDIPVYLGSLKMRWPYEYDIGMTVRHLLFLSWGGESVLDKKAELGMDQASLDAQLLPLLRRVHELGVVHMDVRGPNVLWCEETQKVMLIDFERSITVRGNHDPDPVRAKAVQFHIEEDLGSAEIIIDPPPLPPTAYREYYMQAVVPASF